MSRFRPPPALTGAQRALFAERLVSERVRTLRALNDARSAAAARTLGDIDRALRRLYTQPERFGRDELTDEPIAIEQLAAAPWIRRADRRPPDSSAA